MWEGIMITGITLDSRQVQPGFLFAALKGAQTDGSRFIPQAVQAGAAAVLCDRETAVAETNLAIIRAENPRLALAHMAAAFYGRQPAHMAAVTGTDGKTSTCDFFRQFWHHMGQSSASIGTLGAIVTPPPVGGRSGGGLAHTTEQTSPDPNPPPMGEGISGTTPDPVQLHKLLAELHDKHILYTGMEASSHGLDQYRLDGVKLEAAAFTNLTRDHLDYHKTEQAYFTAKKRLFSELLPEGKTAVLNQDDARFTELQAICRQRGHAILGFGRKGEQFRLVDIEPLPHGQRAHVMLFGKAHMLEIPLVGAFQAMNILAALGLVIGTGGEMEKALAVIPKFRGVPGRLEQVAQLRNGATVFIDYAHTPAALANILKTLRPHTQGALHVVFGCGGDRDAGKRPEMGRIAEQLADEVTVTDDNPRSEDPALIRSAILAVTQRAKEVADRQLAIYVAMKRLGAGDVLVIAGKGHEKTQIVGDKVMPFDDAEVAREAAKGL
ncbi:MAG: UDP-N-acetylmuramoyl-L-alanyl-D-glutamate--2,6-diaminopimelate ligase [Pseudomonadota bacterium]|nr:UDP-N-acetylmuramoyl-L-alanyl-D-glutamate--2,6-diaminopimelate ligase [Pseudomonadota bacterium]